MPFLNIKNSYLFGTYLILFFIVQNNFLLTNKLANDLGLGVGAFRSKILILFIIIGLVLLFFKLIFNDKLFKKRINKFSIYIYCITLFAIFFRIISDLLIYNRLDFIGISPLAECLFFILFFHFFTTENIKFKSLFINVLFFFIFFNSFLEILLYFKDTISGIQYGPFRTNIAGFTINRNPSFFYPIFCLVILKFANLNLSIRIIYSTIFIILVLTLFYRTLYLALLFPIITDWLFFNPKINFKRIFNFTLFFFIIFFIILLFDSYFKFNYNFSFLEIFSGRFNTTFTSNDLEATTSRDQRIDQIPEMLFFIAKNPLGLGFNGQLGDGEIYNYAYYFLHPILYLGWIIILSYFYLLFFIIKNFDNKSIQFRILFHFIVYFTTILILFPYMTYFTFTSIFLLTFSLLNKKIIIY